MKGRKIKETGEASREMDRRNTAYINELYERNFCQFFSIQKEII